MGVQLYVSRSHEIKLFLVSLRLVMIKTMANDSKGVGHTEVEACWIMNTGFMGSGGSGFSEHKAQHIPQKRKACIIRQTKAI